MKRVSIVAVTLWCLGTGAANTQAAQGEAIAVMTRNVYLGGNLGPLLVAATPAEFVLAVQTILAQVAATNFPERAEALADEIVAKKPDLVGLQEVFRFTVNGATAGPPFRDLLDDLLAALAARGEQYYVAAQVRNLAVTIPVQGIGLIGAIDRDVVLARADVGTQPVPLAGCRASLDGCNFQVFVSLASPLGPINIERGFVAVDAHTPDGSIRFVNTHLEVPELPVVVQAAQASELIAVVAALPNPSALPVVIVGDINSAPMDRAVILNGQKIVPPYWQLARAGYFDVWKLGPGNAPGFTCCQASDLLNTESLLSKRVDVIFTNVAPNGVRAGRVGASPDDLTPSGLWPSDHAGVAARLRFEP